MMMTSHHLTQSVSRATDDRGTTMPVASMSGTGSRELHAWNVFAWNVSGGITAPAALATCKPYAAIKRLPPSACFRGAT